MPLAETAAAPTVAAAAAGRLRVDTAALRRNAVLAAMIEREVGALPGVRAVQAFPRAASVVVWHSAECDASIVVAAIGDVARRQVSSPESGPTTSRPVDRHDSGGVVGRVLRALLPARRDPQPEPPEIERLRLALGRLGYHIAERGVDASSAVSTLRVGADHGRARLRWLAVPLGVALVGLTGMTVYRVARWAAVSTTLTRTPGNRLGRPRSSLAVVAASALAVPSWGGVMVTLILVSVAGTVAYRHRLGLTREIVVAAGRAAVQLIAAGTLLRLLFARANVLGAAGWLAGMTIVAGQVAGGRAAGLPQARVAATGGVAASAAFTLAVLQVGRVVTAQARVIVPVGGMIISSAMLAAGGSLRRLDSDVRNARPAIEARLSLGQDSRQAIRPYRQAALRGALIPAIDSTKVVGLISLPGAMTGLILAGISPLTAIRYQIVVMYMQLAGSALASLVALRIAEESLFDDAQRLVPLTSPDELPSLASPTT